MVSTGSRASNLAGHGPTSVPTKPVFAFLCEGTADGEDQPRCTRGLLECVVLLE